MKKLLVLVLVLGMSSLASAAYMQLSVDGLPAPDEITLDESDTVILDVTVLPGFASGTFAVAVDGLGSIDWSSQVIDPYYRVIPSVVSLPWTLAWKFPSNQPPSPQLLVYEGGNILTDPPYQSVVDPRTLIDELLFHCDGYVDVTITLMSRGLNVAPTEETKDYIDNGTVLDTLIIHQIPEPMTMALLGLGGLALIRRRR